LSTGLTPIPGGFLIGSIVGGFLGSLANRLLVRHIFELRDERHESKAKRRILRDALTTLEIRYDPKADSPLDGITWQQVKKAGRTMMLKVGALGQPPGAVVVRDQAVERSGCVQHHPDKVQSRNGGQAVGDTEKQQILAIVDAIAMLRANFQATDARQVRCRPPSDGSTTSSRRGSVQSGRPCTLMSIVMLSLTRSWWATLAALMGRWRVDG
jgi:hypothetical protein